MNKQIGFLNFKSFAAAVFCFLAFSGVSNASALGEKLTYSLVVSNLSAKLKTDLAQTNVSVELSNIKQQQISKNEIAVEGDALAILTAADNRLPIRFAAKIDVARKSVSGITYDFVEAESASVYAPTVDEESLMKTLLKQVSRDYKTDQIVIALDGVQAKSSLDNAKEFSGVGEIRIGDLEWNKINFDVVIGEKGKAGKIVYSVQK